jgi:alpha-amylase
VRAAHARGMKVILDEEFQYVAEGHPWWRDNEGRPGKPEGRFLLWNDPAGQTGPEPLWGQPRLTSWDGTKIGIAMVDLNQPGVRPRFTRLLGDLADPHGDGRLADGVDGFRIDHMMDDLDSLHRVTNLFAGFWTPLITDLKRINPRLEFIAEQYDWGYGQDFLTRGGADAVFAFPLRQAITKLDKAALTEAIRKTAEATPEGKRQLVFIENHDVDRYASLVGSNPAKLRIGAVLNLTLGGDAIIYYGQELGMRGLKLQDQGSDANDIPQREAFRWRADLEAPGSAIWYQGPHAWWTGRANRSGDGVSVEEEEKDPGSLLSFYRRLTALRAERPELGSGRVEPGCADPGPVFCFTRRLGGAWTFVAVNLSDRAVEADAPRGGRDLMNGGRPSPRRLRLVPWGVAVIGS